jgi:hypothetical protein
MIVRPILTRRHAITGAGAAGLVALSPLPAMLATGAISALFAEWEAAWGPYLTAIKEYGRIEEIFFADRNNPEKEEARDRAEAAMREIERGVIDLEHRIRETPAATLADVRFKLLVRSKTIGMGDCNIDDAGDPDRELLLRLLTDVERLAGRAVAS